MQDIVEQLPVDEAYNFIRYAIQHHPQVAASLDKYRQERDLIPNQNPTVEGLPWCRCGECRRCQRRENGFAAGRARHQGSALPGTADAALCVGHTCS